MFKKDTLMTVLQMDPAKFSLAANATMVIDVKTDKDCPTPVYDFKTAAAAWSYYE